MANLDIKERLHAALHRGHKKATEEQVVEVAAVITVVMTELVAEIATVLVALEARVKALEPN